ncbi:MAG: tRNA (adenosine(37)-N6)-threonylcarbamoyltransferase complex ATPase subunit type 1 TsaE [Proteobacteria bacterium]|nr:tRNA (adenosine(37)-N6)-threonylcarbamoyltransferase complex ATPase subunit type 1 TsaE [Pseudomonadota bacterium]
MDREIQVRGMHGAVSLMECDLADETATGQIAARLAGCVAKGDVIALSGGLGAGKTAFARALINALPGGAEEVPSPTFTLVQTYDRGELCVYHFDLYRIEIPDEVFELGIDDAFSDGVSLIEWPERMGRLLPERALTLRLSISGPTARHLSILGGDAWRARLERAFGHG